MSMARRKRRYQRWVWYVARFMKPENGGMLDMADPIGHARSLFRANKITWPAHYNQLRREGRRSR